MSSSEAVTYGAFLSYAHAGTRWAEWLHEYLESFRVNCRPAPGLSPLPKALQPFYRAREDVSDTAVAALDASAALIVLCSAASVGRPGINEVARVFRMRHAAPFAPCEREHADVGRNRAATGTDNGLGEALAGGSRMTSGQRFPRAKSSAKASGNSKQAALRLVHRRRCNSVLSFRAIISLIPLKLVEQRSMNPERILLPDGSLPYPAKGRPRPPPAAAEAPSPRRIGYLVEVQETATQTLLRSPGRC